jgi:hypothetical protein
MLMGVLQAYRWSPRLDARVGFWSNLNTAARHALLGMYWKSSLGRAFLTPKRFFGQIISLSAQSRVVDVN